MEEAKFTKNDKGFVCQCCKSKVEPLGYTSRDHCPKCLCSLHVDINPGDRNNNCHGLMIPIDINYSQNKGYIIKYKCSKCGAVHNNKMASDDDFKTVLKVMNKTYDVNDFINKK